MTIKLEVGKTYLTRNGEEVTITSYQVTDVRYPYRGYSEEGGDTFSWTEDGRFDLYRDDDEYDLVKEVTEPVPFIVTKTQTPEQMQRGLAKYMGFTEGTQVRVVAKVERANGVTVLWSTRSMDKLLAAKAVGVVARVTDSGLIIVRFNGSGSLAFLPQCLDHASPQPATVPLNHAYAATVTPNSGMITVGCQNFTIGAIREVVKTWEELNPDSAVK